MTNSAFVHLVYHLSFANSDELKLAIIIKDLKTEGILNILKKVKLI